MANKALLIVDVQNDFCAGGSLAVPNGNEVIDPINRMVKLARNNGWDILASRDWHPEETKHFELWPRHCVQGTSGAAFHSNLKIDEHVRVISKGVQADEDGYSAFEGHTSDGQSLIEYLKARQVDTLYIAGLATDYCVKASAIDAARLGFHVVLLLDASRAVNLRPTDEADAIAAMQEAGVIIGSAHELVMQ